MIRNVRLDDAQAIATIYNYYIKNTTVTFEEILLNRSDIKEKIQNARLPWFVYEEDNVVLGFAYASEWNSRYGCRFSAECSVYLEPSICGEGVGTKLYQALLSDLEKNNYHAIMAAIALPNEASVALHEKFGFEKVAALKEVGYKFNQWIDVGFWQVLLNR